MKNIPLFLEYVPTFLMWAKWMRNKQNKDFWHVPNMLMARKAQFQSIHLQELKCAQKE